MKFLISIVYLGTEHDIMKGMVRNNVCNSHYISLFELKCFHSVFPIGFVHNDIAVPTTVHFTLNSPLSSGFVCISQDHGLNCQFCKSSTRLVPFI